MADNISNISDKQTLTRKFNFLDKFSRRILRENTIHAMRQADGSYEITFPVGTTEKNIREEEELLSDYFLYTLPSGQQLHYMDSMTLSYLGETK